MERTLVLKVGGAELVPGASLATLAAIVARTTRGGIPVVLVHGGGPEVSREAERRGLAPTFVDGQRVTDSAMLEVVVDVLAGRINTRLVAALEGAGVPSVGLTGVSHRLLPVEPEGGPSQPWGWVGSPLPARVRPIADLLEAGLTPVVAPLGVDANGHVRNVNADLAAAAIAAALGADLALVTDVDGVKDEAGAPIARLAVPDARRLVQRGAASGGMIPKLRAAEIALHRGASSAWVGPLTDIGPTGPVEGHGTRIVPRILGPVAAEDPKS